MKTLSIIVPVYNKERYIDECIQSILNQTFTDFELILVNDGSTDGSLLKCRHYEKLDDRVLIIDQENKGVSFARNIGVSRSNGSYIGFVDSDDTIDLDMYELLVKNALDCDADVSVCRMRVIFPYKSYTPKESLGLSVFNSKDTLSRCLKGEFDFSANNKIYRSDVARQVKFEGRINEDILYLCKIFVIAKRVTVAENIVKYNYILRDSSVSMSKFNLTYMETLTVADKIEKLVLANNAQCLPEAKAFTVTTNLSLLNLILLANQTEYRNHYDKIVNKLRDYSDFISKSNAVRKKHKYAVKFFLFSPSLYKQLMHLYCIITNAEAVKRSEISK